MLASITLIFIFTIYYYYYYLNAPFIIKNINFSSHFHFSFFYLVGTSRRAAFSKRLISITAGFCI